MVTLTARIVRCLPFSCVCSFKLFFPVTVPEIIKFVPGKLLPYFCIRWPVNRFLVKGDDKVVEISFFLGKADCNFKFID